jgi:hypothetical protein
MPHTPVLPVAEVALGLPVAAEVKAKRRQLAGAHQPR